MSKAKVSVLLPVMVLQEWQYHMTKACVDILRCTTEVPFEIVLVETVSRKCSGLHIDKYHYEPKRTSYTRDANIGIDLCSGDYVLHTGNDIFVKPGWLEALLKCFTYDICGVATLASSDLHMQPKDVIAEGLYGPFMLFPNKWRFDEDFPDLWSDSDLIMRIYEQNQMMLRNWEVQILHFPKQTLNAFVSEQNKRMEEGKIKFIEKHKAWSYLSVYNSFVSGRIV